MYSHTLRVRYIEVDTTVAKLEQLAGELPNFQLPHGDNEFGVFKSPHKYTNVVDSLDKSAVLYVCDHCLIMCVLVCHVCVLFVS